MANGLMFDPSKMQASQLAELLAQQRKQDAATRAASAPTITGRTPSAAEYGAMGASQLNNLFAAIVQKKEDAKTVEEAEQAEAQYQEAVKAMEQAEYDAMNPELQGPVQPGQDPLRLQAELATTELGYVKQGLTKDQARLKTVEDYLKREDLQPATTQALLNARAELKAGMEANKGQYAKLKQESDEKASKDSQPVTEMGKLLALRDKLIAEGKSETGPAVRAVDGRIQKIAQVTGLTEYDVGPDGVVPYDKTARRKTQEGFEGASDTVARFDKILDNLPDADAVGLFGSKLLSAKDVWEQGIDKVFPSMSNAERKKYVADNRAKIARMRDQTARILKQRSGAAATDAEREFYDKLIADVDGASLDTIIETINTARSSEVQQGNKYLRRLRGGGTDIGETADLQDRDVSGLKSGNPSSTKRSRFRPTN